MSLLRSVDFSSASWLFDECCSGAAVSGSDLCSSVIAHLPQTQKDINDAVSEVWCQSESWRLRQFTHACCVVRVQPRGERHVRHQNDSVNKTKTWILKKYQQSAHVMWHSLLGSELSCDPVFIKRWGGAQEQTGDWSVSSKPWWRVCVCYSHPALS